MRLLLVTHYYPEHRSGVEIVAGELAARLAERGIDITWAASAPESGSPPPGVRMLEMRAWDIAEKRLGFPYPLWGPVSLLRLCREVRRSDAVHLHDCLYMGNIVAYVCARLLRKPVIVTQHIGEIPYSRRTLRWLLEAANRTAGRLVLGGSRTVFISEKVRKYFLERIGFRWEPQFVPNGLDTLRFCPVSLVERARIRNRLGWQPNEWVILFVGRFVEKKGLHIMRRLAERFPDWQWVFIGWGAEDPVQWRLSNVQSPGGLNHEDISDYYRAADLFVLPSLGEGFPLVVQEAMGCGTPVVITYDTALGSPGIEEVALVANPELNQLAQRLKEAHREGGDLELRRKASAEFARRHWDWERCADRYAQLLTEVMSA